MASDCSRSATAGERDLLIRASHNRHQSKISSVNDQRKFPHGFNRRLAWILRPTNDSSQKDLSKSNEPGMINI
jgi:hypothetical protein